MPGIDRSGLRGDVLSFLTVADVEQIHQGALQILGQTSLVVHDAHVLSLLDEAGCPVVPDDHHPLPLTESVASQLDEIVHRAETQASGR
jgi:trimethylamine:corrinoid methyltransferase-like protein